MIGRADPNFDLWFNTTLLVEKFNELWMVDWSASRSVS